ncbi:MAG TPA: FUSC family protein [Acidisoma sp.]|uniref:FUSC family protein n=1 Tax=Acidisoma sp. TaxID=1872115 RepID=UPI002CF94D05|nr:FUSC family protein [Acidisoma sp.]HTI00556.1 FUSC family protein [Acidisoma sp.]
MALPATERIRGRATRLVHLLAPFPGRLEVAGRLALICALTALVTEIYQTPDAALTVYVAFFLIKADRVTSIILSLVMLTVLTVTLLFVLPVTILVADQPMWRVAAMALISFGLMFLASSSKLRAITPIVALIAAYALDLLGTIQIGEIATRVLLYAWLFVGIPAGVSIVVNLLIGPAPRRLAERALAHRLRLAAGMLRSPNERVRRGMQAALRGGLTEILTWLKLAGMERTSPAGDLAALQQAAASTMRILLLTDLADRMPASAPNGEARGEVADTLDAMATILASGSYPVEIALTPPPTSPDTAVGAAWMAEMDASLTQFAVPPPPPPGPAPAAKKPRGGLLVPDAFTNPIHVHLALKTTAAAMFCYVFYSLLDWPTIHTCLITCYIVALGTAAETVEKLTLRVLGCMLGAAAGIGAMVYLIPDLTSIGALMVTVFVASLAAAWVAVGNARIAYAGFQIAFAFFLCVIQGAGPSFDMVTARDRVIGILLGNLVVYLIFTTVWPVSVTKRIDPAIAALLRKLGAIASAKGAAASLAASQAETALGALERDLDLSSYEPMSIRPGQDWLGRRRDAAEGMAALTGALMLSASRDPALSQDLAGRLGKLADDVDGVTRPEDGQAGPARASEAGGTTPLAELNSWMEPRLRRFEDLAASVAEDDKAVLRAAV